MAQRQNSPVTEALASSFSRATIEVEAKRLGVVKHHRIQGESRGQTLTYFLFRPVRGDPSRAPGQTSPCSEWVTRAPNLSHPDRQCRIRRTHW